MTRFDEFYSGRNILITGAAGTVGKEITRQLAALDVGELRLMDNNESEQFFMYEEYRDRNNVFTFLGDVRDREKLEKLCSGIDILIHCAAFKHVILSEYNPFDLVQTNIIGTENVIRAATSNGVKRVLFTSSDKSVNPTNVMGTSKLMGEKLITAANTIKNGTDAILSSTRFGNVIGSRGSVVPLFAKQIRHGGPVTLTDRRMTRFVMTTRDSAKLVLESIILARGGEVFVTKMPVVRISDLAEVMVETLAPVYGFSPHEIEITEIGAKPGEKLYEELMTSEESNRAVELKDMFSITPAFKNLYKPISHDYPLVVSDSCGRAYISSEEEPVDKVFLKDYLIDNGVISTTMEVGV